MRFGVGHLVGADHHIHQGFQAYQGEPSERSLSVLAGDQTGLNSCRLYLSDRLHHSRIDRHHPIVMLEIVLPVGRNHRLEHFRRFSPWGELDVEWRPNTAEPLLIGSRRDIVLGECVMIAVEDEPDGIDQGAVEVEQCGLKAGHGGEAIGSGPLFAGPKSTKPVSFTSSWPGSAGPGGRVPMQDLSSDSVPWANRSTRSASPAVYPPATKPMARSKSASRSASRRRTASLTIDCKRVRARRVPDPGWGTIQRRPRADARRWRTTTASVERWAAR